MAAKTISELAVRLVGTVTPWLDSEDQILLRIGLGTDPSRQVIATALDCAAQKQCVLPADLVSDLANLQRPRPNRPRIFYGATVKKAG